MNEKRGLPLIVRVSSYEGCDTFIRAGAYAEGDDPEAIWRYSDVYIVVDNVSGAELDAGYRSHSEAAEAWKNAINAN